MAFDWATMTEVAPPPAKAAAAPTVRARYDNALTTPENQRQWIGTDALSAKSANSFQVRRVLRNRSRYEVSNNPYLWGICLDNAAHLIGSGPTLKVLTDDAGYNREVEAAWKEWCQAVDLVEKLTTAKLARTIDGEGFLVFKTVEDLETPVKLWPADIEADQVTTYSPKNLAELWVDGLDLHPVTQRPVRYHVLKTHPGDFYFPNMNPLESEKISADYVCHTFPKMRAGQVRGVPQFTPSLDLWVELRSYRRSVVGAAEIAADYAAVLEQDAEVGAGDPDEDADTEYQPFKRVPLDRKGMAMLPPGAKLKQLEGKQPLTQYEGFHEKCVGEACRPLSFPVNLALGTSQKFNFSSSKLDFVNYFASLDRERERAEALQLRKLFRAWFAEAVLAGWVRQRNGLATPPHEWHWPGHPVLDPTADAQADAGRLSSGTSTYKQFWAARGYDWRDVMAQQAEEQAEIERLGLRFGEPAKLTDPAAAEQANPQLQEA
jgi:lambda family phage portal protein